MRRTGTVGPQVVPGAARRGHRRRWRTALVVLALVLCAAGTGVAAVQWYAHRNDVAARPDCGTARIADTAGRTLDPDLGVTFVMPPGFRTTTRPYADSAPTSYLTAAPAVSHPTIVIVRTDPHDYWAAQQSTSRRAVDYDIESRNVSGYRRGQWNADGLDGASVTWPGRAYSAWIGCRGLRWHVFTTAPGYLDAADGVARSLREIGTSTLA